MRNSSRLDCSFSLPLHFRPGLGAPTTSSLADGSKLLDEGDKLADAGQFTEAVIRYKSGMEKLLPRSGKSRSSTK